MGEYDLEYFFIRRDEEVGQGPALTPDTETEERRYAEFPPAPGSAPLIFTNGYKDEFLAERIKYEACDILFDGIYFIVRDRIRQGLLTLDLPGVYLHPAVYIDDRGNWHEDYRFVGVYNVFDCWDRDKSTFGKKTLENMFGYFLNAKLLDETPLENRLLFKIGGAARGLITCHQSIAALFRSSSGTCAVLQPITEY